MNSAAPQTQSGLLNRGQTAVLAMLAIATLAALFAWWWNFNRGRKALEFFGVQGAALIRTAPRVEILRPAPESNIDISRAPGLLNARASLLGDASFDWDDTGLAQDSPLFSVQFSRDDRAVTITFDFENRTISNSATQRMARLKKKTADGWQSYLARQIKQAERSPATPPEPTRTAPLE